MNKPSRIAKLTKLHLDTQTLRVLRREDLGGVNGAMKQTYTAPETMTCTPCTTG